MTHTILRLPAVIKRSGLSRSTVYLMMQKGKFPSPISLSVRAVGWLERDISDWLEVRIENARNAK